MMLRPTKLSTDLVNNQIAATIYCTVQYSTVLYSTALHCTALYYSLYMQQFIEY